MCGKQYKWQKIETLPNVYMMYWKKKSRGTVTHLVNFEMGLLYRNTISPS
ncbi:MoaF-related domain-containing protein [Chryseobacterium metallicongregator]